MQLMPKSNWLLHQLTQEGVKAIGRPRNTMYVNKCDLVFNGVWKMRVEAIYKIASLSEELEILLELLLGEGILSRDLI